MGLTAFKTAGTVLAATYHIPLNCLSGALEKGCKGLCTAICGRRRMKVRKGKKAKLAAAKRELRKKHRKLGKKGKKHHKKAAAKRELRKKHRKLGKKAKLVAMAKKAVAAKKAAAKRELRKKHRKLGKKAK